MWSILQSSEKSDSFIINISISAIYRLTARILDVSNSFQNKKFPIHEILYVSPPPYYLDCFKIYYPNIPFNLYDGTFFPRCKNVIQGTKTSGQQWNILLDVVVTILKYNKSTIYHAIYIKLFSDGTVSYITVSKNDVLNTTNNETAFYELTIVFEEHFEKKVQEGYVLKYLNFRICKSLLGFSLDQTDRVMKLVN